MFKELLSKFAESKISVKIAAAIIIAVVLLLAAMFGFSSFSNEPDVQNPPDNPEQVVQPEQQPDDDIIDIEDIEDVEDIQNPEDAEEESNGIKDVISNIIGSLTGKDKEEDKNKAEIHPETILLSDISLISKPTAVEKSAKNLLQKTQR